MWHTTQTLALLKKYKKWMVLMKRILLLITTSTLHLYTPPMHGKMQFRQNTLSVTAYKVDPNTHTQTWSIQTTDSPQRGARNEHMLSSSTIISSKELLLLRNRPTYVFVYKNPRAAETPVTSTIQPDAIKAAGPSPVMLINADGTATLVERNSCQALKNESLPPEQRR